MLFEKTNCVMKLCYDLLRGFFSFQFLDSAIVALHNSQFKIILLYLRLGLIPIR